MCGRPGHPALLIPSGGDRYVTVTEDIYIPRIHVASIETCGCVASWNPSEGHLTLYMTTQAPHAKVVLKDFLQTIANAVSFGKLRM